MFSGSLQTLYLVMLSKQKKTRERERKQKINNNSLLPAVTVKGDDDSETSTCSKKECYLINSWLNYF